MIFAKRQAAAIAEAGQLVETFFLASRTEPTAIYKEYRRLRRTIAAFQPDIVHSQFGTVTALLCALATARPLVITFYGGDLNPDAAPPSLRVRAARFFSQLGALRARRMVCVSRHMVPQLWWRRSRVSIIPCGVDTRVFTPQAKSSARQVLGWRADERIVLFNAGSDPRRKRLDLAERAVECARGRCGAIRLVVLRGDDTPEQVALAMNGADCMVVTSDSEGSPTIVQEALACRLPIVSVPVGDIAERLDGVRPSCIVPRDPVRIGDAVCAILASGRRSNGDTVLTEIALPEVARRLIAVYRQAVGEPA